MTAADAERLQVEVSDEHDGARLDQFLAAVLPHQSRSQIQRLIREGLVHTAFRHTRPSTPVHTGDRIAVEIPAPTPAAPQPQGLPLPILHDDPDLVVVNKPAGMVVHPAAGHPEGTLVNALLHHIKDLSGIGGELRPGIVHRLDRGTSGVMVIAKNDRAHEELARQFHDREVEKEYLALVWGRVNTGTTIDRPIGRHPKQRQKMSTRAPRARTALTRVVEAEFVAGLSFLRVAIATGR
ncbi:MAG: RluA family pseudouridine synthase, partial [Vicinamibacterales bacterium]